ncbi:TetR/AcrR family transcriptional regulator [Dactylosporangium sp. NPDC048998]|uniref:TetR/AcrR family transcriptional regulator n=1 Tax=Dactylosporangium sp. NPDC048998 TaxID=3363976 RepID=UPI0037212A12
MRKLKESRRPEILDAALTVAAERGLDALSMRAVAQHLGLTPMALYGYFRSKDELLDGVVGRLLSEIPAPPAGIGWRETLERMAYGLREVAARHPAVLPLLLTRPAISPAAMRIVDITYEALLAAGIPPQQAPRLERMLSTFVIGHTLSEVSGRFGDGTLDPQARRAQVPAEQIPGHHALAEHLDTPIDWTEEFHADLRELFDLVESLARPEPSGRT